MESDSTTGVIRMHHGEYCPRCEGYEDGEEFHYMRDIEESWCDNCTDHHAHYASDTGDYYGNEANVVEMHDGTYRTQRWFANHGGTCEATSENHHADVLIYVSDVEQMWHRDYWRALGGFQCQECNDTFSAAARGARRDCCESCTGEAPPRDEHGRFVAPDNTTPF